MLIPLKKYIENWLDTYTVKDIFTGEIETAREIFDWNKSYLLKLLIKDGYYVDTEIDFATKHKNYLKIVKKPLSEITPKKIKKFRVIGRKRVIDHYITETVDDYEPVEQTKYRMVNDYDNPIYDTVIKRRKIGKKYVWATEYIPTGKYHKIRQYYTVLRYVKTTKTKKRPVYKWVDILEPYYEQIRERQPEDYKTQVIASRDYEPFFVFEYYKSFDDNTYEHYLYISPFFRGYGNAVYLYADKTEIVDGIRKGIFIPPEELRQQSDFISAVRKVRFAILNGRKHTLKEYFREANERIENGEQLHTLYLRGSYKYSLDVLDLLFYRPAPFKNNEKTIII